MNDTYHHRKTPNLLIIGHARHGKDTLAEIFERDYNMTFKASSVAASEIFIYDMLKDKYGYKTTDECFNDRVNLRTEWYNLICLYNKYDKSRLAKDIMSTSDCYVGMRDKSEILECKKQKVFDIIIWVDASRRLPHESSDSFNVSYDMADIVIYNDHSLEEFELKAAAIGNLIFK